MSTLKAGFLLLFVTSLLVTSGCFWRNDDDNSEEVTQGGFWWDDQRRQRMETYELPAEPEKTLTDESSTRELLQSHQPVNEPQPAPTSPPVNTQRESVAGAVPKSRF